MQKTFTSYLLSLLLLLSTTLKAEHQKIITLTVPRTISTAFEKSMIARSDHKVLHEPWVSSYMYHKGKPQVFTKQPPQDIIEAQNYEEVKQLIYRCAEQKPVFLKDMIWCIVEEIYHDEALLSDPHVIVALLIRDPAKSIESFFLKGLEQLSAEKTIDATEKVFRYDALVLVANKYSELRNKWPIIIEAEELCRDPQTTYETFCKQAAISYIPEALAWEKGMPEEWEHFSHWHVDAAESNGFYVPKRDEPKARFSMIPEEYVPLLEKIYQEQLPFYEELKKIGRNGQK